MECSVCYETENLTFIVARTERGKNINLKLCPKHLDRFQKGKNLFQKHEEEAIQKCCATQINSNGHCAVCGDRY